MKTTKIMASLVAVCMLATCMFCIAGTGASNGDVIRSDEAVVIDIDKSFQENETQLAKLGITDYKSWQHDDKYGCYVLTLKDVHYITSSMNGLVLVSHSEKANPKVVIELEGNNSIVSGSKKTLEKQMDGRSIAVLACHLDSDSRSLEDINVVITGEGSLEATNANLNHDICCASGIFVGGNLTVCDGAVVVAVGGNIDHNCTGTHSGSDKLKLWSAGVVVIDKLSVIDASLFGTGGDYYLMFEDTPKIKEDHILSDGIAAGKYYVENGYVHGTGGSIEWGSTDPELVTGQYVFSISRGVTYTYGLDAEYKYSTEICDSYVIGIGDIARGNERALSFGISLKSADTISIKGSVVAGKSNDVFCSNAKKIDLMSTYGIYFESSADIRGSMVQGISGDHAVGPTGIATANGIVCNGDLTVVNSIIGGESNTTMGAQLYQELGISILSNLNVADSEIYAKGDDGAISVLGTLTTGLGNRGCYAIDDEGKRTTIDASKDAFKNNKSVEFLYKYDLIIMAENGLVIDFERLDDGDYVVEPYIGYIPEGMEFAGYVNLLGDAVEVGSHVTIDEPLVLVALFDVVEEPDPSDDGGDNGTWIAWIIVIVALIAVALLVAGICIYKRS